MKILKQKDLKKFREKHHPKVDPISLKAIVNPTLDHCHDTGFCRGVLDASTNCFLGKVENAFKRYMKYQGVTLEDTLYFLGKYVDNPPLKDKEILHPKAVSLNIRKFGRYNAKMQESILAIMMVSALEISSCKTKKDRVKLYKKHLLNEKNIYKN